MRALQLFLLAVLALTLPGCEAIASIFEAGFWVGAVVAVILFAVVSFVVARFRGGSR